ncbi:tripartite tricarboxylate transporter substrate binding protein [Roseomonas alkaliterrae]|uniref:Tripartite-type tricarboxylate transporter receptor subunit TctC n=1 Tax=Neoroseomonas alkaliterrae TaxID=1452450 RepID=A0A840XN90_9PROT|nr:tripartite tricarboxylate transporter substrate binding protein [Neoroseomonas alkaliterrae]MBB5688200.1 tripartite-type tricarboxylate transporter receptor subunit TctC [Neoroseomonas alkaliterrae]MBR0676782.1 tripartite tricarboxylate transporter substrate binding protein [Neoroseomonas alkaliterrae]
MNATRRALIAATLLAPAAARAQAWAPTRAIRFVVPFPAGGATDVVARVLGERMQETLGQPVVVENRTGAGGNIGVENVVRSPADGHTILMGTTGTLTVNPHLYSTLGFDPLRDLAPVSMAFTTDHVLIVNPQVPARTAQEFLALVRGQPGRLSYGSAGAGSSTHTVPELFKLAARVDITHVPYRGSAPALNDVVAGNVQVMLDQIPSAIGQIQAGRVRALAVTGARRSALLPDVPTMAEIGLPEAQATSWGAVMAPAGTPAPAIARLNAAIRDALAQQAVRDRLAAAGAEGVASSPEELAAYLRAESEKWARVVREARITVN